MKTEYKKATVWLHLATAVNLGYALIGIIFLHTFWSIFNIVAGFFCLGFWYFKWFKHRDEWRAE